MKRMLSTTNLSSGNNLPMFQLNVPVIIRAKVKRCKQRLLFMAMHYWGYRSLEVKGRWGLVLFPLPPHHNGPATRDFRSSISVETLLWGCHLVTTPLYHHVLKITDHHGINGEKRILYQAKHCIYACTLVISCSIIMLCTPKRTCALV